ncbi:MAG: iron-sulfur cluster assembly accessory protein [Myxococcales bacterium]|nr:iron-sulfur cluster assembly accessory protein [Myxococcales bacterium]
MEHATPSAIAISPKALKMAKKKVAEADIPVLGLRLGVKGGGCSGVSYVVQYAEHQRTNDHIFEFDGLRIFVDEKSLSHLAGTTLEWEEKLMGYGFKFRNPKAKSGCGCGSSFAI